jgi:hypothetical protein
MRLETCPSRACGRLASELPACASPSLTCLTGLEGRDAQLHQLLLGGVVGGLQRLGAVGCAPQRGAQAWTTQAEEIKRGMNP